ncbi:MAG TPA: carboxyl transferase domain-containing protein, partial [Oscillatoriaceae cyanobacterium]
MTQSDDQSPFGQADLLARRREAEQAGDPRMRRRLERMGSLDARTRLQRLFDPGTFVEWGQFVRHQCRDFGLEAAQPLGDGLICGHGEVNG